MAEPRRRFDLEDAFQNTWFVPDDSFKEALRKKLQHARGTSSPSTAYSSNGWRRLLFIRTDDSNNSDEEKYPMNTSRLVPIFGGIVVLVLAVALVIAVLRPGGIGVQPPTQIGTPAPAGETAVPTVTMPPQPTPTPIPTPFFSISLIKQSSADGPCIDVAYSHDGSRIATTGWSNIHVFDASTGEVLRTDIGPAGLQHLAFSPDGTTLPAGTMGGEVLLFDAETGAEKGQWTFPEMTSGGEVLSIAYSPDGTRLAVSIGDRGFLAVVDAATGTQLLSLEGHTQGVRAVAFSSDGTKLASAGADNTAIIWDAATGESLLKLEGHKLSVMSVAFSPDAGRVVTGSYDNTVVVWDAETGGQVQVLSTHKQLVTSVRYSPDGRLIVAGLGDGSILIWDAQTFEELMTLTGHTNIVSGIEFSPDGTKLASCSSDETLILWSYNPIR
jgi:WD40 repeat protein